MPTPIGEALVVVDERGRLLSFDWEEGEERMHRTIARHYPGTEHVPGGVPNGVRIKIEAYFGGDLAALNEIECFTNGTPFQQDVWAALRRIPAGKTLSYGALASMIGRPAAVRAVGLANGSNPIGLVQPCHRVIGAGGSLTGYGGGIDRKRWLLEHEGVLLPLAGGRAATAAPSRSPSPAPDPAAARGR
jgi:O-6-methylguanine DNA methyltransferase